MNSVILAEPSTLALLDLSFFFLIFAAVAMLCVVVICGVFLTQKKKKEAPQTSPPATQPISKNCPKCGAPMPPDSPEGLCPRCLIALNLATQTEIPGEPGAAKAPPGPPLPVTDVAKLFPQLEILECLGRGGMGAVYKARQPRLDRLVALKIISPEKQGNQKFGERFEREARALAKLHHPNIVTVFDFGEAAGNFYLLMEFVDGLTLRQLLQARKLSPPEALAIVPKICEALQYAHERGIVHRDIKPENILMDKDGRVKIADFGIAKILGEGNSENLTAEQVIGTPHYMSPEQIERPQAVDHRADIYSLGVVFYEMLTGELPLGKFQPPSKKVHIDVRLDEIVLRALEKEPERRYQQASEVKTQVEEVAATAPAGNSGEAEKSKSHGLPENKSAIVRIVEIFFNTTFKSRLALNLVNLSALGFLGFLGFLGYWLGMRWVGFSGFAGFFGLIGVAFIVEFFHRRKTPGAPAAPVSRFAAFGCAICLAIGLGSLILALVINEKTKEAAPAILNLENNGAEIANSYAVIQSWSSFIHLNRYVFKPLAVAGILGAIIFGWLLVSAKVSAPWRLAPANAAQKPGHFWSIIVLLFVVILLGDLVIYNFINARLARLIKSDYTGQTWFPYGDSIEITSVERMGNQMTVQGRYNLVSHDVAALDLYVSTTNSDSPQNPEQSMNISKGNGEFQLTDTHVVPGLPHVSMYAEGHPFAALYFGTKEEAEKERQAEWITNTPAASVETAPPPLESSQLSDLQKTVDEADVQLLQQKAELAELSQMSNAQLRQVLPGITKDSMLYRLLQELDEAQQQSIVMSFTNGIYSPYRRSLNSKIDEINRQIDDHMHGLLIGLKVQMQSQQATLKQLQELMAAKSNVGSASSLTSQTSNTSPDGQTNLPVKQY